jgi:CRISPR-associated endonuclease/helicase Cas3
LASIHLKSATLKPYPNRAGLILQSKLPGLESDEDSGDDNTSQTLPVLLTDHIAHVVEEVQNAAPLLGTKSADFLHAAQLHDHGKAELRFQTLLRDGDALAARIALEKYFLAKSGSMARSKVAAKAPTDYPEGFRHELLSLLFAEQQDLSALALHLIATHHGYCRPFAPVIADGSPPPTTFQGLTVSAADRLAKPMHHLSSGLVQRFWELTRRHGWWGLAYYEAVFRLADWAASAREADAGARK